MVWTLELLGFAAVAAVLVLAGIETVMRLCAQRWWFERRRKPGRRD
jgi:hypothetical protein